MLQLIKGETIPETSRSFGFLIKLLTLNRTFYAKEAIPLELNSFVTEKLYHHKHFPSNAFSLLGEALKNWLNELLGLSG